MSNFEKATFAGGCFWCMVKPFDQYDGIERVISGYTGGSVENPTYEQVKAGNTGHQEAVEITFDPTVFPYEKLLEIYWQQVDPTDNDGQFQDRGESYRASIFYHSEEQRLKAEQSKKALADSGRYKKPVITPIVPAAAFYSAEDYHQDFYKKSPKEYKEDIEKSGRIEFLSSHW
ncbi:peptide-methionine (S)-S-oxide reductase MsrA [Jeotgalibacillus soli]|uniref:Peptide methionine sulfoxide reductase MsrA n=1 Tax=Jeotgalibacillus soli TaxID=889306 RepID=A0A0C2VMX1_9BACL|nr:peptide-methionine (S)-S-oxide reductase MsrA [Jeotgalibacillus soli]KIL45353.1 methionine sulfoxide reductase A [Jeotgalibacillus soli]